ncbi:bifunctional metallophosphatase/5'-nucleotidase [Labilithrix luteola]|nr:metallophosphoesterase [Labilithrix luteola]
MRSSRVVAGILVSLGVLTCAGAYEVFARAEEEPSPPAAVPVATTTVASATPTAESFVREGPDRNATTTIGTCDEARRKGTERFTLAHFNDLQARYSDRLAGRSRYAYIAGYLRQLKKDVPSTLVLDAGDDYEKGAIAEVRSMGETTRRMVQALPIDVRTIGNHDFAYGEAAVLRDARLSAHPVLAANVRHADLADDEQPFRPFVRIDIGCVKVGIIGLVTQNFGADDRPTSDPYDHVFFHDDRYARILEREVKAHRDEVDVLIALTHLGYFEDSRIAMLPSSRGVDLFVGAHTEDLLRTPVSVGRPGGTRSWIVQAGHFGLTLGRADFAFDHQTNKLRLERYRIVDVDASLPMAEDVAALAEDLERGAAPTTHTPVGKARKEITVGSPMTALVARAAKDTLKTDALLLGRDLFWTNLPRGPITLQRMYEAMLSQRQPAGTAGFSSLWTVHLSGRELEALRRRALGNARYELVAPKRIDPSARYCLALDKRAVTYSRSLFGVTLPEATFGGELIDVLERYAIARTAQGEALD